MPESPRRVDLRLTISPSAPWREIAVAVAVKFAEYAGAPSTTDVAQAVIAAVGSADGRRAIPLLLSAADGAVTVSVAPSTD